MKTDSLEVTPVAVNNMAWEDGMGVGEGDQCSLVFALPQPQFVYSVTLTHHYEAPDDPVSFRAFWRWQDRNDFSKESRNVAMALLGKYGEEIRLTFMVMDTIDQFRIHPHTGPFRIRIDEILLTVADKLEASGACDGRLEGISEESITGWAWNRSKPETTLELEVYDGNSHLGTVLANQVRSDLACAGIGNGKHGFKFSTPNKLRDGRPHIVRVLIAGTTIELRNSPMIWGLLSP
jgi:hypothetical protein